MGIPKLGQHHTGASTVELYWVHKYFHIMTTLTSKANEKKKTECHGKRQ